VRAEIKSGAFEQMFVSEILAFFNYYISVLIMWLVGADFTTWVGV